MAGPMTYGLYPQCLPFEGGHDPVRANRIREYLRMHWGPNVTYAEVLIQGTAPKTVQPRIGAKYAVAAGTPEDGEQHLPFLLKLEELVKSLGLQVTSAAVTQVVSNAAAGAVAGGAVGSAAAAAIADSNMETTDRAVTAIAAALGATLFGAVIGSMIQSDGALIANWRRDEAGLWTWHSVVSEVGSTLLAFPYVRKAPSQ